MKNGYFKITKDGEGYGLLLVPPKDGGEPLSIVEIMEYLKMQGILYSQDSLQEAICKDTECILPLGNGRCPMVNMQYDISVSEDSMRAFVRIYSPSDHGEMRSARDIVHAMNKKQISVGIREEAIAEAIQNGDFCKDILAAEGMPVREGKDASIEYFFNTDPKVRPTLNEDGSVDFFHLNVLNHCKCGDLLARLTKEDPGDSGMTIYGAIVKPRPVKRAILRTGKNVEISEDGTELISLVNGHVSLVDEKVVVANVLELKNVDTSTGNIDYEGSVNIAGNVQTNFSVKAGGNIVVNGLVEGALLEAGGDIIIARGMAGAGKGSLKAGGNIVAKFLENTSAVSGGYVATESILHSTVMAQGDITVDGKKGFISGGRICATNLVKVKTLGSHLGTVTVIEVGATPDMKEKLGQLKKSIADMTKKMRDIDPVITTYAQKYKQGVNISMDQMKYLKTLIKAREKITEELRTANSEAEKLDVLVSQQANAQVIVQDEAFPGVRIVIGEASMTVQNNMHYCRFVKVRGDVKMVSM